MQHCRPCEAGWFCNRAGLTKPEGLCDPGHYCTSGASTGSPVSHIKITYNLSIKWQTKFWIVQEYIFYTFYITCFRKGNQNCMRYCKNNEIIGSVSYFAATALNLKCFKNNVFKSCQQINVYFTGFIPVLSCGIPFFKWRWKFWSLLCCVLVDNLCLEFSFAQVRQFVSMVLCERGREHKKRRNRAIIEVKTSWFLNQNTVDWMAAVVLFFT